VASPLKTARDTIATDWAALTPASGNLGYRHHAGRHESLPDGASGHRVFWFGADEGEATLEIAGALTTYEHRFTASVRFSTAGVGTVGELDFIDDVVLLINTVNNRSSWGAGIRAVTADTYSFQDTDSDDIECVIALVANIEETDG